MARLEFQDVHRSFGAVRSGTADLVERKLYSGAALAAAPE